jgi:hypothetical protein
LQFLDELIRIGQVPESTANSDQKDDTQQGQSTFFSLLPTQTGLSSHLITLESRELVCVPVIFHHLTDGGNLQG